MIYLDAFSSRCLDSQKTPFISELSHSALSTSLEPLFAYAGIGVSAFTGARVNTHKIWADYIYTESKALPALLKGLLRLSDILPGDILNQYARYVLCRIFRRNPGTPNLIPVELVDFFRTKEKKRLTDKEPLEGITTLFDQLGRYGTNYFISGLYESLFENYIVSSALKALAKDYWFILLKLGSLDRLGHKYGPESEEVTRRLGEIDKIVKQVITRGTELNSRVHFIIFSDHGMVPVSENVDLGQVLQGLPLRMPDDYLLFLNSTVANFWFHNERAKEIIVEELGKMKQGIVLDKSKLAELEIENIGPEYGDLMFALEEGYVFFPDYYRRRRPPKGMHGYAFATYDKPAFIVYSPGVSYKPVQSGRAGFIDVMPTILGLLDLPIPSTCEGKNLLEG